MRVGAKVGAKVGAAGYSGFGLNPFPALLLLTAVVLGVGVALVVSGLGGRCVGCGGREDELADMRFSALGVRLVREGGGAREVTDATPVFERANGRWRLGEVTLPYEVGSDDWNVTVEYGAWSATLPLHVAAPAGSQDSENDTNSSATLHLARPAALVFEAARSVDRAFILQPETSSRGDADEEPKATSAGRAARARAPGQNPGRGHNEAQNHTQKINRLENGALDQH